MAAPEPILTIAPLFLSSIPGKTALVTLVVPSRFTLTIFIQTFSSTSWKYLAAGYVTPTLLIKIPTSNPLIASSTTSMPAEISPEKSKTTDFIRVPGHVN
ncbi:hypothetical protein TorRG33x02_126990 [Trema orientale]|uniref:Uncharacterized protein n=1 Tax=Trema orientale TaxID=63057 RepID=A0A2P5F0U7_TREOI|nr:hypothetical protein TorRG33x02_126990 [Trema orientale]